VLVRVLRSALGGAGFDGQNKSIPNRFDCAVVVQTVIRPSLERAVRSVFEQDFPGTVHILVGVDVARGDRKLLKRVVRGCPRHMRVTVFDPGYSTSARHGGVHANFFGGSLRTLLSFAAASQHIAYLDDDDWYAPNHLKSLRLAINGRAWAHSRRNFVNPANDEVMCEDKLENLGVNAGHFAKDGGFVCASSLMVDKLQCAHTLHAFSLAGRPQGDLEDRLMLSALAESCGTAGDSGLPTVNCVIKPEDEMTPLRLQMAQEQGYDVTRFPKSSVNKYSRV
jgi:hypothetical protein